MFQPIFQNPCKYLRSLLFQQAQLTIQTQKRVEKGIYLFNTQQKPESFNDFQKSAFSLIPHLGPSFNLS